MKMLRSIVRWVLIALGVLFLLGLLATIAAPDESDEAVSVAPVDVSATATATPESTPEPTAEPTPSPSDTSRDDALAWGQHIQTFLSNEGAFMQGLAAVGEATTPDEMLAASMDIWFALTAEVTWATSFDPPACVAEAHADYTDVIRAYEHAYDVTTDALIASDLAGLEEGIALQEEAIAATDVWTAEHGATLGTTC